MLAVVALGLVGWTHADAQGRGNSRDPGRTAYSAAKRFAEQNNLPHFFMRGHNNVKRIVVNVPQNHWDGWCSVFSAENCYIEPNFRGSKTYKPGWSYLRIGNKHNDRYGAGSECRFGAGKVHFPVKLSQSEFTRTVDKIRNSPNGSWDFMGGNPETSGRNCTNWVTEKIGRYTGVGAAAVQAHFGNLMNEYHSPRSTVVGITSTSPLTNFNAQNNYFISWQGEYWSPSATRWHSALPGGNPNNGS
jgi:hypothetical protein